MLESWREGGVKSAILDFVDNVAARDSDHFVPPEDRIAVFDNDGTLWCEKPLPVQADFVLRPLAAMVADEPSLVDHQPWKAIDARDHEWLSNAITKHHLG